jgi:hypothetical protein
MHAQLAGASGLHCQAQVAPGLPLDDTLLAGLLRNDNVFVLYLPVGVGSGCTGGEVGVRRRHRGAARAGGRPECRLVPCAGADPTGKSGRVAVQTSPSLRCRGTPAAGSHCPSLRWAPSSATRSPNWTRFAKANWTGLQCRGGSDQMRGSEALPSG